MGNNKMQRLHRISFMLNEHEYKVIEKYIKKHKIVNKSNFYRTTLVSHVIRQLEEDYPLLFDEKEMR